MPYRSTEILSPGPADVVPLHTIALAHDQRHLRRKLLHLPDDDVVMLDLKEAVMLADGDLLVLDSGDYVRIAATEEALYDIRPRDRQHLIELAWHLGNRHLPAELREDRILIARDPVIRAMLERLGADVSDVTEPFQPMRGAYHGSGGHSHGHGHSHAHG
ncbi:urease accessory protein UreE [Pararhizobium antarcticum]|uniref:Urease accessory protein UreE n=1 Tax=Pararhizobium antarcticum TaxID=1798805 RepID=A0A657LTT0_9HYPH|nr:urease accessory protein UreE [Pararhizobium antarcticum]OJF97816.1 urease accessory protein UreE [Rhizobium sp. 58]OJF98248.1 urease accessory protein UreE [Pararhizobium antarcticum]